MQISKKLFMGIMLAVALTSAVMAYQLKVVFETAHQNPESSVNVFLVYERFSGRAEVEIGNVITDIGENQTRERFSTNCTTTDNGTFWISIGNSSAVQTETQLDSQYGSRGLATIVEWTNGGDAAHNCTYQFQFTETQTINATGSHWSGAGNNNMYAVAALAGGSQTFNNNENLTVRWVYTYNCND